MATSRKLVYNREIKHLVFFYKAVYGCIDINVSDYVLTFNNHPRTRRGQSAGCYLTFPACKTSNLQASYFETVEQLSGFTSLSCFKSFLKNLYKSLN